MQTINDKEIKKHMEAKSTEGAENSGHSFKERPDARSEGSLTTFLYNKGKNRSCAVANLAHTVSASGSR